MTGDHYEDWELLAYDNRDESVVDLAAVDFHLLGCSECVATLDGLRSLLATLDDTDVHEFAKRKRHAPDPALVADATERARRAADEDRDAEETFDLLMRLPIEKWSSYVSERPSVCTEGLIRRLILEARDEFDRRAKHSLRILAVASDVASSLADMRVRFEYFATIAKERSNALRMLSRYAEALNELERAKIFLNQLPVRAFDIALLEWARASVLFHMTRYTEALGAVRRAAKVLRQFGDIPRAQQARLLEAGIIYEMGDAEAALATYQRLETYFREQDDLSTLARVIANIAECEVRLDRAEAALTNAHRAMKLYEQLDNPSERTRVQWTLGEQLLRQGDYERALKQLHSAATAFEALGMESEAGGALLDIVEIHVTTGQWDEAIALAHYLGNLFAKLDAPAHAARAFSYLRDAVEARRASVELVKYIREYVEDHEASRPFSPPSA